MSTPRTLRLPDGVRRVTIGTARGAFAALEALPVAGACERQPALLVPGYTGSKEDFIPVLAPLAAAGRRVVAIDMRGQYESPAAASPDEYDLGELATDVALVAHALSVRNPAPPGNAPWVHLLGHSFGGLVAREAMLGDGAAVGSLTLMSSGPGTLSGPRATVLRSVLSQIDSASDLAGEIRRLWETQMEPQAIAEGAAPEVVAFLRTRMLASCPTGLKAMAASLLACPDRTADLAGRRASVLVVYGENDDAWHPTIQEDMAERLGAQRVCIPGAAHSPAVEAPETAASTLTSFWNSVECSLARTAATGPAEGPQQAAATS